MEEGMKEQEKTITTNSEIVDKLCKELGATEIDYILLAALFQKALYDVEKKV